MDYHILDIIVIALVTVLGLKGLFQGMVKEIFGLLGLVGGVFIASRVAGDAGGLINTFLPFVTSESGQKLAGFASSFLAFWALMIITGAITSKLVQKSGLGILDKLGGAVIGAAKIFFIFAIVAYAFGSIGFIKKRVDIIFEGSTVYPLLYDTGAYIMKFDTIGAQDGIKKIQDQATKHIEDSIDQTIKENIENMNTDSELQRQIDERINQAVEEMKSKEIN